MLRIGCHLSSSRGFLAMGKEAVSIGANTFQFFTRNPRGGKAKELDMADLEAYVAYAAEHDIARILAHAPYTLNACSNDEGLRNFARDTMADDLARLSYLPESMYNFHPGCHMKQGTDAGIAYICQMLNEILKPETKTVVLLETMAGKGSEVGRSFEELRRILDGVELSEKMGVCLDTCHVHDAEYDIVNELDRIIEEFDAVIGLGRLRAIHINDSKNPFGSHKDRHEKIGEGSIGLEALARVINHPKLRQLPFFLETPNELPGYAAEIALLKSRYAEERQTE